MIITSFNDIPDSDFLKKRFLERKKLQQENKYIGRNYCKEIVLPEQSTCDTCVLPIPEQEDK